MASSSSQPGDKIEKAKFEKKREKDLSWYLPLYRAVIKSDWDRARTFLENDPDAVTAKITKLSETALHIAVGTKKAIHVVEKLLEMIPAEALETLTDSSEKTVLHLAAMCGNIEAAKLLVAKNPHLPNTWIRKTVRPIHMAAVYGQKEIVSYLLTVTKEDVDPSPFTGEPGVTLLNALIGAEFYDMALQMVQRHPRLATLRSPVTGTALRAISRKPFAFPSGTHYAFWQQFIYSRIPVKLENLSSNSGGANQGNPTQSSRVRRWMGSLARFFSGNPFHSVPLIMCIKERKLIHCQAHQLLKCMCMEIAGLDYSSATSLFQLPVILAAEFGIHEVVEEVLEVFPAASWFADLERHDIFQLVVINRRENIFNLIYQRSEHSRLKSWLVDSKRNTILHLAGRLAPKNKLNLISGAVLQMQRELLWYKEVKRFVQPDFEERKNAAGKTPAAVFTEEHKDLVIEGERWLKDTAKSCSIAAALIVTTAFAAAITVPGGSNGDNGFPIFSKEGAFIVFAVSEALSLFSSTASLLMFLSILTARYAETDFLYALPRRLVFGLVALLMSITSMMTAFSATLYLMFGHKMAWRLILMAASACIPVTLFMASFFPLLVDMFYSAYGPGIFGKQSHSWNCD